MNSQLYTAASGLIVEQRRLDMISNNLANLSTAGYRPERLFASTFQRLTDDASESARTANASVAVAGSYEVPGGGPVRRTDRPLDIALEDGILLAVESGGGRRYSRAGGLTVSPDGELLDGGGHRVLDSKGEPINGLGATATISSDGRVMNEGAERAKLMLVSDPGGVLVRVGSGLLSAGGRDDALEDVDETDLRPGWLESSGTNALGEMVLLIEAQRAFENYQKLVSATMNEVNRRAVNDLADPR
jgi:flagellar basal-body rod protein FlgG